MKVQINPGLLKEHIFILLMKIKRLHKRYMIRIL